MEANTIKKLLIKKEAEAKRKFDAYQESGDGRYYREYKAADDLANICRLALQQLSDVDDARSRRRRNINAYKDRIAEDGKMVYTKQDLYHWLDECSIL